MKVTPSIEDLRQLARRRVPRAFFEFVDSGSYTEQTFRANVADLEAIKLRQRVMVNVDNRDLSTTILGEKAAAPISLGPIGLCGMQHGNGEILSARAAQAAGLPFTLSTMSICSIEDVAAAVDKPFWFQLYVMRDRGFIRELIERARAVKCSALVLTVDLQVLGQRHRDLRNGMTVPPRMTLANLLEIMRKPAWAWSILNGKRKTFGNLDGHLKGMDGIKVLAEWTNQQFDPRLNWKDAEWIRDQWGGKMIIKGVLDADDAALAAKTGADALIVSNHGGRQLDGASSSIAMLPKIVDAVGSRIEVMFDGGIRTGADILRAIALGARSCMIGRAYVYGLGANGQAGVAKALDILKKELDVAMALCGVKSIEEIGPHVLADSPLRNSVRAPKKKARKKR